MIILILIYTIQINKLLLIIVTMELTEKYRLSSKCYWSITLTLLSICENIVKTLVSFVGNGRSNASRMEFMCSNVGLTALRYPLK